MAAKAQPAKPTLAATSSMHTLAAIKEKITEVLKSMNYSFDDLAGHLGMNAEQLNQAIDEVCQQIPGFYFGRLDLMFESWAQLEAGQNFQIVELNGSASEPTHIYDPSHSIFFAWKEIARHLGLLYRVSVRNHQKGYRYLTVQEGLQMFRENKAVMRNLAKF